MFNAVQYAPLVGKYIRMERPPKDEVEWLELGPDAGPDATVGCEGTVACVKDVLCVGGWGIAVVMDYGIGYTIFEEDASDWRFAIWPDDATAREFRG